MSLDGNLINEIRQVRMNELCGKYIHQKLLKKPKFGILVVDSLCVVVPILFFAPRLLLKGSNYEHIINYLDVFLGVLLLAAATMKFILKWEDRVMRHRIHMANNVRIANTARSILISPSSSEEEAKWFLRFAKEPVQDEMMILEEVSITDKQFAFREALREFEPGTAHEALCPVCNSNVFKFEPGDCEICGGKSEK